MVDVQLDGVAHVHLRHVHFNGQCASVFHGVVEDGGDFAAQAHAAKAFVGHEGHVFASKPQHAVGGRFAARTSAHHIAHIGYEVATDAQIFNEFDGAAFAVFFGLEGGIGAGVFEHGQRVQGYVGAAPCVGGGGEVVGIGFARYFKHGDGDVLWQGGAAGKPFGISPALQHGAGVGVACFGFFAHVMKLVEHEQGFFQTFGSYGGQCAFGIVKQLNQGANVVAAQHGA